MACFSVSNPDFKLRLDFDSIVLGTLLVFVSVDWFPWEWSNFGGSNRKCFSASLVEMELCAHAVAFDPPFSPHSIDLSDEHFTLRLHRIKNDERRT